MTHASAGRTSWAGLGNGARAFRVAHAVFSILQLAGLSYVWACAVRRTRSRLLAVSIGALLFEGAALLAGRGDCPFGPLQERLGDPVPLFELVLPRGAAKAAIPVLAVIAVAAMAAVALRPPIRPICAPVRPIGEPVSAPVRRRFGRPGKPGG